jgi:hypothetical protein
MAFGPATTFSGRDATKGSTLQALVEVVAARTVQSLISREIKLACCRYSATEGISVLIGTQMVGLSILVCGWLAADSIVLIWNFGGGRALSQWQRSLPKRNTPCPARHHNPLAGFFRIDRELGELKHFAHTENRSEMDASRTLISFGGRSDQNGKP